MAFRLRCDVARSECDCPLAGLFTLGVFSSSVLYRWIAHLCHSVPQQHFQDLILDDLWHLAHLCFLSRSLYWNALHVLGSTLWHRGHSKNAVRGWGGCMASCCGVSHLFVSLPIGVTMGKVESQPTFALMTSSFGIRLMSPVMYFFALEMPILRVTLMRQIAKFCFSSSLISTLKLRLACFPVIPTPMSPFIFGAHGLKRCLAGDWPKDLLLTALVYFLKACNCFAKDARVLAAFSGPATGLGIFCYGTGHIIPL